MTNLDLGVGCRAQQHKLAAAVIGPPGGVLDQVDACREQEQRCSPKVKNEWQIGGMLVASAQLGMLVA